MIRRLGALLLGLVLAGCGGGGVSFDAQVDELGKHIVEVLKADPAVADASYRYEHGLDSGQHLRVTVTARDGADPQALIDTATKTFWQSPAKVYHLAVAVQDGSGATLASDDIQDGRTFDGPELDRRYGPRPTR